MIDTAVHPTGYEERLSIGMKQNAVRPASRGELFDHAARLRIDDVNRIVKQAGGIDQAAVRTHGYVADKIDRFAARFRRNRKGSCKSELSFWRKREFIDTGSRATPYIHELAVGRERQSQPAVLYGRPADLA